MKKNFTEIEEIIENRITVLEKEYDLDRWDIQEIRTEAYRENGWGSDPFPLDEEAGGTARRVALPQHGGAARRGRHEHEGLPLKGSPGPDSPAWGLSLVVPFRVCLYHQSHGGIFVQCISHIPLAVLANRR